MEENILSRQIMVRGRNNGKRKGKNETKGQKD